MFVQMSGALLPSFSLFCPAIAQPLAEMLMQLVPIDVISQGDRRPLLHHCPGIAIRLTPSKPRKRSPGGDDCSRDRPVRSSEVATTSRMKRTSATFDERSWAPSAAPMSMGPKADSADLQPVASAKSPIRPDHSHWLPGAYSQKVAVHRWSYAYCTLHRARTETFTWLFAGLMGAAAWRPVRRASTTISGSLLEQIIVPGCAASQRTGKVWRYQRGFSMRSIERQTFQQSNDWFPAFEETYGDRFG